VRVTSSAEVKGDMWRGQAARLSLHQAVEVLWIVRANG
jgi:hypothetical protein